MISYKLLQQINIGFIQRFQLNHVHVATGPELLPRVKYVGDASAHSRSKVATGFPQDHRYAARHVLTTMVAGSFHHHRGSGVPDTEALSRQTADIRFARRRPVKGHISDNDVFFRLEGSGTVGIQEQTAPAQSLPKIIVRIAFQLQGQPAGNERAKALPGRSPEFEMDRA